MREEEFGPWLERVTQEYAQDTARNKEISDASALEESKQSIVRVLPQGFATPAHEFEVAEDAGNGQRIGSLWYAREPRGEREVIWVYELFVEEPHRGRGFGRRLMELLEERARSTGIGRIGLNVFGDNTTARTLYESLGYQESARQMHKDLDRASPGA
jgi:GNAT superfamily N-acetyltransferase